MPRFQEGVQLTSINGLDALTTNHIFMQWQQFSHGDHNIMRMERMSGVVFWHSFALSYMPLLFVIHGNKNLTRFR
ncbi:hypothetical protein LMCDFJHI_01962 [Aeromonas salmonicida]